MLDSITETRASLVSLVVKNLPINAGDMGLIPEVARSPGEEPTRVFSGKIPWTEEPCG